MIKWPKYWIISLVANCLMMSSSWAQSGAELSVNYVGGLAENDVRIWNSQISSEFTNGFDIRGLYTYHFKAWHTKAVTQLGYKRLYFSGTEVDGTPYSGNTQKLALALGGRYLFDKRWAAGAYLDIENNLDFDDYRTQTSDLLRYALTIDVIYRIRYGIGFNIAFSRAIYPLQDHYLIFNPTYQFRLGINWSIL